MSRPTLKSTQITNEQFAGLTYHIEGPLVPTLTVELTADHSIYFEHHVMLWKNTTINIQLKALKGAIKRFFAGIPILLTQASGQGQISFSRDGAGQILPVHLAPGEEIDVREHQFLAASDGVEYGFQRMQGVANVIMGGNSFFIDKFRAKASGGIVWLHGYGNVFEKVLAEGEQIDVEPGAWLYKDPQVQLSTQVQTVSTGFFASSSLLTNRFTGPGRVGIQSMSVVIPQANNV